MTGSRVLVIEDSAAIRLAVIKALGSHGFDVRGLSDGQDLESHLADFQPDLVVLDVMLPGRDGFVLLGVIRSVARAGVVMLTARDETVDRVRGLAAGADDYLIKPFAMSELVARIHAVLRRIGNGAAMVAIGDLDIADEALVVRRNGTLIELTETERRLLAYLASHRDRVVSKTQILTAVWGYDGYGENVVEVHISSLRRKLELHGPRVIQTMRGRGYLLGNPT